MSRVAIVTDSASDLPPEVAAAAGITVVPLVVSFGAETFRAGVEPDDRRVLGPDDRARRAVPHDGRGLAGRLPQAFQAAFDDGADSVVCVTVSGDLSGTLKSAQVGRERLPDREIHVIDSRSASMGHGMLAQIAAEMAAEGVSAAEIAAARSRSARHGSTSSSPSTRSSTSSAAAGSAAPVRRWARCSRSSRSSRSSTAIVENAERVRTRAKARERCLELLTQKPMERATVLHTDQRRRRGVPGAVPGARGLDPAAGSR